MIDFQNFHDRTVADFEACGVPMREPDFVSPSRSVYWDLGDRVIRASDHWGRVRSCHWTYEGLGTLRGTVAGVCAYRDFFVRTGLTIERERRVVIRPGTRGGLDGAHVSLVPPGGGRRVVEIVRDTPFRLVTRDGWVPRRSVAAAWVVEAARTTTDPSGCQGAS